MVRASTQLQYHRRLIVLVTGRLSRAVGTEDQGLSQHNLDLISGFDSAAVARVKYLHCVLTDWEASEILCDSLPGIVVMKFDLVPDAPVEQFEDVPCIRPDWLLKYRYAQALPPRCRSTRNMWKWVNLLNLALATWSGLTARATPEAMVEAGLRTRVGGQPGHILSFSPCYTDGDLFHWAAKQAAEQKALDAADRAARQTAAHANGVSPVSHMPAADAGEVDDTLIQGSHTLHACMAGSSGPVADGDVDQDGMLETLPDDHSHPGGVSAQEGSFMDFHTPDGPCDPAAPGSELKTAEGWVMGVHPLITPEMRDDAYQLILKHKSSFAYSFEDLIGYKGSAGPFMIAPPGQSVTGPNKPIVRKPRRRGMMENQVQDEHMAPLLKVGFIERCTKQVISHEAVIAAKKDADTGLWTDTRCCYNYGAGTGGINA